MDWKDQVEWVLQRFIEILDFSQQSGIEFSAFCMAVNYTFVALLTMIKKEHGEKTVEQIIKYTLEDVKEVEKLIKTLLKEGSKWKGLMIS